MKCLYFIHYILLIVFLYGCTTLINNLTLSYDLPTANTYWIERTPPTEPLNEAESLAAKSASGLMTLHRDKESTYYDGQDGGFTIIRHENITTGEEVYLISVKYRFRDGLIYGETIPFVIASHDPEKEEFARSVALSWENGSSSNIPVIYGDRFFVIKDDQIYGRKCNIDVVEKDLTREYATYHIKTC